MSRHEIRGAIALAHAAGPDGLGDFIRTEPCTGRNRHRCLTPEGLIDLAFFLRLDSIGPTQPRDSGAIRYYRRAIKRAPYLHEAYLASRPCLAPAAPLAA